MRSEPVRPLAENSGLFVGLPRPLLMGHRGACAHAPENTLPSFELAARTGAHVLELDVHCSRDGQVVVCHDATLERTTDGHGALRDHTYAELARLDAGYHFVSRSGGRPFRGAGTTLPLFEDVLRAFPDVGFNVEIKQQDPPIIERVLAILERVGPAHVLLAAGDDAIMTQLEAARPGVPLGLSRGQCLAVLRGTWLGGFPRHLAGRALQVPPRLHGIPVVSRRLLRLAHRAGIEVHLWTINDPRAARRWLELGVDALMSDDPGALADLFAGTLGSLGTPRVGSVADERRNR